MEPAAWQMVILGLLSLFVCLFFFKCHINHKSCFLFCAFKPAPLALTLCLTPPRGPWQWSCSRSGHVSAPHWSHSDACFSPPGNVGYKRPQRALITYRGWHAHTWTSWTEYSNPSPLRPAGPWTRCSLYTPSLWRHYSRKLAVILRGTLSPISQIRASTEAHL